MLLVELKVNKRPYIIYGLIYLFGFCIVISFFFDGISQFWDVVGGLVILTLPYVYLISAFWFYRIELFEDVLIDKGLKSTKNVPIAAITNLKLEVGYGKQKWLWGTTLRPFRRVAVYYEVGNKKQYLDISLVHLKIQNVRELFDNLIKLRPDLEVPIKLPKQQPSRVGS
jgi:hypothetical protein